MGIGFEFNMIVPLLPFSFVLEHEVSFSDRFQHLPANGCSIASRDFGVLIGDECMVFCSTILGN